jgi:hypothetical protein
MQYTPQNIYFYSFTKKSSISDSDDAKHVDRRLDEQPRIFLPGTKYPRRLHHLGGPVVINESAEDRYLADSGPYWLSLSSTAANHGSTSSVSVGDLSVMEWPLFSGCCCSCHTRKSKPFWCCNSISHRGV